MNTNRIEAALADDNASRIAYAGRLVQKTEVVIPDRDGNPIHHTIDVVITWDTIKTLLSMIRGRLGK